MRNVLVFQHVAHELLGTLNPLLKSHGLRIKYVNFERDPEASPKLEGYSGLIVLGGPMGVYEAKQYPHLLYEMKLIEEAFKRDIPVMGICLGAQLMAHVLGARVEKHRVAEIGWHRVELLHSADSIFSDFKKQEVVFQMHGDHFEIPKGAEHLARAEQVEGQAFRYGKKAYGTQFHLEVDEAMILRWLKMAPVLGFLKGHHVDPDLVRRETQAHMERNLCISEAAFKKFVELFELPERPLRLGSR